MSMEQNKNTLLEEIKADIKEILLFQREFQIHKNEQEKVNSQVFKDLKQIEERTANNENKIDLLIREDDYFKKTDKELIDNLKQITKLQNEMLIEHKETKNKTATHSKFFWGLFSLNITIIGYLVKMFIERI